MQENVEVLSNSEAQALNLCAANVLPGMAKHRFPKVALWNTRWDEGGGIYVNLILKGQTQQMSTWLERKVNSNVYKCSCTDGMETWGSRTRMRQETKSENQISSVLGFGVYVASWAMNDREGKHFFISLTLRCHWVWHSIVFSRKKKLYVKYINQIWDSFWLYNFTMWKIELTELNNYSVAPILTCGNWSSKGLSNVLKVINRILVIEVVFIEHIVCTRHHSKHFSYINYLKLTATLWGRYFYYPYFTDERSESQER